jgi:hypothetical protein
MIVSGFERQNKITNKLLMTRFEHGFTGKIIRFSPVDLIIYNRCYSSF